MTCLIAMVLSPAGAAEDYDSAIEGARSEMATGNMRGALERLRQAQGADPARPEAPYWIGEVMLETEHYAEAAIQFGQILVAHPGHVDARHRRWLAMLARDHASAEIKKEIAREIQEHLAAGNDDPVRLFAAHRGYQYLWDDAARTQVMLSLAVAGSRHTLAARIAGLLLQDILVTHDKAMRARLATLFIDNYSGQRGIDLATHVYVRFALPEKLTPALVEAQLRKYPGNRHLKLTIADRLLRDGVNAPVLIESLLAQHRSELRDQSEGERGWYHDATAWRQLKSWEEARNEMLRGWLQAVQGDNESARNSLLHAAKQDARPWRVWARLADAYRTSGSTEDRMNALQAALQSGPAGERYERELLELIRAWEPDTRSAARYYARGEGVPEFTDITAQSGLSGVRGSRVAWGDYDNDGWPDLLTDGPRVFRNTGSGQFVEVTTSLGLAAMPSDGGSWADVDNDGWLDLFLTGRWTNRLYRNLGGARFSDVTSAVFGDPVPFPGHTEASAWGDMNNDGWLDLYTANYEKPGLDRGMCFHDQLFRNDHGVLRDWSVESGARPQAPLCGRGVIWADLDGDGMQEIIVANYRADRNLVWRNHGNRFTEDAGSGVRGRLADGAYGNTIGIAAGDVNNDGRQDLYVSNLAHPRYLDLTDLSHLLIREGEQFVDRRESMGIAYSETSADPVFADFDNDGDLDLYVTGIYPGADSHLYRNDGDRFTDISWISGARLFNTWGVAVADIDRDGDLDLVVAGPEGLHLLRNDGPRGHWVQVVVRSSSCNRLGVGARVTFRYGDRAQVRELQAGRGTGSQDELVAHVGLGAYSGPVQVEARDLCGATMRVETRADERITIRLSKGDQ